MLARSCLLKYDPKLLRERSSSPRLLVHSTALMTAAYGTRRRFLLEDPELKGRLVESTVGAYLVSCAQVEGFSLNWWREGKREVDFIVSDGWQVMAIEVKSGRVKSTRGLTEFVVCHPGARTLIVGSPGCTLEDFLLGRMPLLVQEDDFGVHVFYLAELSSTMHAIRASIHHAAPSPLLTLKICILDTDVCSRRLVEFNCLVFGSTKCNRGPRLSSEARALCR